MKNNLVFLSTFYFSISLRIVAYCQEFAIPIPNIRLDPRLERLSLPHKDFFETNQILQKEESILRTQIVRPNTKSGGDHRIAQAQSFQDEIVPFELKKSKNNTKSGGLSDRSGTSSSFRGPAETSADDEVQTIIQPPPLVQSFPTNPDGGNDGEGNDWNKFSNIPNDRSLRQTSLDSNSDSDGDSVSAALPKDKEGGSGGGYKEKDEGYNYDKPSDTGYNYPKPKTPFALPNTDSKSEGSENVPKTDTEGYNYPKPSNPLTLPRN